MRDATRGLPERSPILVILSPKNTQLRSSDGLVIYHRSRTHPKQYLKVKIWRKKKNRCTLTHCPASLVGRISLSFPNGITWQVWPHGLKVIKSQSFNQKEKKRGMQHEDFLGGHPSQYYSPPRMLSCEVFMGSGALVLV